MRIMYDSVSPAAIPLTGAALIGCYTDGSFANVEAAARRFPHLQLVTIDVNGSQPHARVLDYEPGDVQDPGTAVEWAKKSKALANQYPTWYCDRSDYPVLVQAAGKAGLVIGRDVWFWIATLDDTWRQFEGVPGIAAVQYQDFNGQYDVSVVLDDNWLPSRPVSRPATIPVDVTNADRHEVYSFTVGQPGPAGVPAVVAWYGDEGLTVRETVFGGQVWQHIAWTKPV